MRTEHTPQQIPGEEGQSLVRLMLLAASGVSLLAGIGFICYGSKESNYGMMGTGVGLLAVGGLALWGSRMA